MPKSHGASWLHLSRPEVEELASLLQLVVEVGRCRLRWLLSWGKFRIPSGASPFFSFEIWGGAYICQAEENNIGELKLAMLGEGTSEDKLYMVQRTYMANFGQPVSFSW